MKVSEIFQKIKLKVVGNVKENSKVQAISTRVNETRASEVRSKLKKGKPLCPVLLIGTLVNPKVPKVLKWET